MESFIKLTDVCDFQGGTQPPKSVWKKDLEDGYIRMLQIRDFTQREKDNVEYIPYKKTLKTCEEHDILIGRYGASVGKICTGLSGAYNVALVKTKPNLDKIRRDFLLHLLRGMIFQNFILNVGDRAAQAGFNKGDLEEFEFSLPPLDQQKKIAAILDAADTYRQKTKALITKYDELTQSLFLDMFGNVKDNPHNFNIVSLNDICTKITDGEHGTVERLNTGKLYLMARNIRDNYIDLNNVSYISDKDHQRIYKRCGAEKGDLLLVCVGATIGRTCITPEMEDFSLARSVALLKPKKEIIDSFFLYSVLSSNYLQEVIKWSGNSSAQAGLYTGKIKKLEIFLPPIILQNQFADSVKAIEAQKAQAQASLAQAEDLFNSLLQRAFKGELV
jgi:type I restriction enzyme S subunit